jgi:hypothetical protein
MLSKKDLGGHSKIRHLEAALLWLVLLYLYDFHNCEPKFR